MQILKRKNDPFKISPDIKVAGYYDPLSQVVILPMFNKNNVPLSQDELDRDPYSYREFFETCMHETAHWIDNTSTLWGQKHLIKIYNAINAYKANDPGIFFHIAELKSSTMKIFPPDYYQTYGIDARNPWNQKPWRAALTVGYEFGANGRQRKDRPIAFYQFTTSDGVQIGRIPFSISSLTETRATSIELNTEAFLLNKLDKMEGQRELDRLEEIRTRVLYNADYVVYTSAVHLLANQLKMKDAMTAYRYASILSDLALNIPEELFHKISIPKSLENNEDRFYKYLCSGDRASVYIALCMHAPSVNMDTNTDEWIEEALKNVRMPSLDEIDKIVLMKMKELRNDVIDGPYKERLLYLNGIGMKNYEGIRTGMNSKTDIGGALFNAPIILGDGHRISIGDDEQLDPSYYDPIDAINVADDFCEFSAQFLGACRP